MRATRAGVGVLLHAASLLMAVGARAQTPACEMLKDTLAARIDASGVRGYALEAVPADTPLPQGAKFIGTCEAGAYKILYRRWRDASAAPAEAAPAARPAPAPAPAAASVVPRVESSRVLPVPMAAPPAPAPQPAAPPEVAPSAAATPTREPERSAAAGGRAEAAPLALTRRALEAATEHWRWLALLIAAPAAAWAALWLARRRAYDAAGLPRGPRL